MEFIFYCTKQQRADHSTDTIDEQTLHYIMNTYNIQLRIIT